jgi:hypothetical protein
MRRKDVVLSVWSIEDEAVLGRTDERCQVRIQRIRLRNTSIDEDI